MLLLLLMQLLLMLVLGASLHGLVLVDSHPCLIIRLQLVRQLLHFLPQHFSLIDGLVQLILKCLMHEPVDNNFLLELLHPCVEGASPEPPPPTSPTTPPGSCGLGTGLFTFIYRHCLIGAEALCRCKV